METIKMEAIKMYIETMVPIYIAEFEKGKLEFGQNPMVAPFRDKNFAFFSSNWVSEENLQMASKAIAEIAFDNGGIDIFGNHFGG